MRAPDKRDFASHVVHESCAIHREGRREALTGLRKCELLGREMCIQPWVPALLRARRTTHQGASSKVPARPGGVRDPGMRVLWLHGNWEICGLSVRWRDPAAVRIGKARSRSR